MDLSSHIYIQLNGHSSKFGLMIQPERLTAGHEKVIPTDYWVAEKTFRENKPKLMLPIDIIYSSLTF